MPDNRFGFHFSLNDVINLFSRPDCYIFNAVSIDTHISEPYAIWPHCYNSSQYVCLWKENLYNNVIQWILHHLHNLLISISL